jgi:hypothetical protein
MIAIGPLKDEALHLPIILELSGTTGLHPPLMVVSATSVCRSHPRTSERAVSKHLDLTGSGLRKRWYQQLPYVDITLVPVREPSSNISISLDQACVCSSIGRLSTV